MNSSHSPSKASSQQLPALDTNGRSHCPLPATRGRKLFSATWKPCPNTLLTGSFAVVISPAYEDVREDNGRRLADDDERFKQERGKVFGGWRWWGNCVSCRRFNAHAVLEAILCSLNPIAKDVTWEIESLLITNQPICQTLLQTGQ